MNKKSINYTIFGTFLLIFFSYSIYVIFNKESFTKVFDSEYIFTMQITKDFNQKNISSNDLKSNRQLEFITECKDSLQSKFYYEPLYYSIFNGLPVNKFVQINITQISPNFFLFSFYHKTDRELNVDAFKIFIREKLEPFLDLSPSCIGKMNLKFYG